MICRFYAIKYALLFFFFFSFIGSEVERMILYLRSLICGSHDPLNAVVFLQRKDMLIIRLLKFGDGNVEISPSYSISYSRSNIFTMPEAQVAVTEVQCNVHINNTGKFRIAPYSTIIDDLQILSDRKHSIVLFLLLFIYWLRDRAYDPISRKSDSRLPSFSKCRRIIFEYRHSKYMAY